MWAEHPPSPGLTLADIAEPEAPCAVPAEANQAAVDDAAVAEPQADNGADEAEDAALEQEIEQQEIEQKEEEEEEPATPVTPAERLLGVVETLNQAFDAALEAYEDVRAADPEDFVQQTARQALERQFNAMFVCLDGLCPRRADSREGLMQALLTEYSQRLVAAVSAAAQHQINK